MIGAVRRGRSRGCADAHCVADLVGDVGDELGGVADAQLAHALRLGLGELDAPRLSRRVLLGVLDRLLLLLVLRGGPERTQASGQWRLEVYVGGEGSAQ